METNCGGAILSRHQVRDEGELRYLELPDLKQIEIAHSLPKIVEPEITDTKSS